MGAPVGGPHQPARGRHRHRLGQRGHQRHHPPGRAVQLHRAPEIIPPHRHRHTLRRYCPPTSKNASLIWPGQQCLTASIKAAKTFCSPASLRRRSAAGVVSACLGLEIGQPVQLAPLFGLGGPGQLDLRGPGAVRTGVGGRVHAAGRQATAVLAVLVTAGTASSTRSASWSGTNEPCPVLEPTEPAELCAAA